MYGQPSTTPQSHLYDQKLYEHAKVYDTGAANSSAAAAYMSWQTPFKYDSLTPSWPTTAAANHANAWYGPQAQGLTNLGQIVKPELHDYTR